MKGWDELEPNRGSSKCKLKTPRRPVRIVHSDLSTGCLLCSCQSPHDKKFKTKSKITVTTKDMLSEHNQLFNLTYF
jgi:hypothetical protein